MLLFSSLVFAMTTTISSLIFVTYRSLSVASLNTFKRSIAIANSDMTTLWTRRYIHRARQPLFRVGPQHMIILPDLLFSPTWLSLLTSPHSQSWRWLALSLSQTGMCCIDRHGFVPHTDMVPQADAEKVNAVADGASQDCRIDQANR